MVSGAFSPQSLVINLAANIGEIIDTSYFFVPYLLKSKPHYRLLQ